MFFIVCFVLLCFIIRIYIFIYTFFEVRKKKH